MAKVDKYNLDWQVARVMARQQKGVSAKIHYILDFFENNRTRENHERILNWLEGLKRGYTRDMISYEVCAFHITMFKENNNNLSEDDSTNDFSKYDIKTLKLLYNDLKKRSTKWLSGGYIHKGQENFLDEINNYLESQNVSVRHEDIVTMRNYAKIMPKTDKSSTFFF